MSLEFGLIINPDLVDWVWLASTLIPHQFFQLPDHIQVEEVKTLLEEWFRDHPSEAPLLSEVHDRTKPHLELQYHYAAPRDRYQILRQYLRKISPASTLYYMHGKYYLTIPHTMEPVSQSTLKIDYGDSKLSRILHDLRHDSRTIPRFFWLPSEDRDETLEPVDPIDPIPEDEWVPSGFYVIHQIGPRQIRASFNVKPEDG